MCSRDDDPTQHDLPRIDWQANIDAALTDVRAMSEALVFARVEIARLKEEITFLRGVLTTIAEEDYRGNEPYARRLARNALPFYPRRVTP
jgi:protein tyrosine/serine phosphatase